MAVVDLDKLSPATRAAFEALRREFITGLPQRWTEIAHAASPTDRLHALHRLAGIAGSYGCAALGQAARTAELLCHPERPNSSALDVALTELHRHIQRVVSDTV